MPVWIAAQLRLIPLALLIAAFIFPMTKHFSIEETSPIFSTKQRAERWLTVKAQAYHCRPTATHAEAVSEFSGLNSPWYGRLECNQSAATFKIAGLFAASWLVLNLALLALLLPKARAR